MRANSFKTSLAIAATLAFLSITMPVYAQAYNDLPGVRPQDPLNDPGGVRCEQVLTVGRDGDTRTNNPQYDTVYSCNRDGGPTFTSPRLPPSIIRQLRGLDY